MNDPKPGSEVLWIVLIKAPKYCGLTLIKFFGSSKAKNHHVLNYP
jgi:hypothetical protein